MIARAEKYYTADRKVKILYAGTNSFDGTKPHVWYVIAEIRASARADGSELGHNGCDAPDSFFIQTKEGWVHVPEGASPEFIGLLWEALQPVLYLSPLPILLLLAALAPRLSWRSRAASVSSS